MSLVSRLKGTGFSLHDNPPISSKGQVQTVATQEREKTKKQGRSSQETTVQPLDRILVLPQGIHIIISLSYSREGNTRPPDLPLEKPVCRSVRTGHGTTDWFQIGKGVHQGCILSPCLFSLYAEYIMRKTGLEEAQAGIKIARRNINNLRYADDTTLMAESEEELKSLLMKVKEERGKVGLKLNIQKTKIMASGPITSWEIDGETVEKTVSDFIFWGSKITADGDCSHDIKRRLLPRRKVMINLDSVLKSRDITLPTKVRLVKAMVFPMVMYVCESWTVKKAEH